MVNLYPESGWVGFVEAAIFIFVLLAGWFIWCVLARWTGRPRVHAATYEPGNEQYR